MVDQSKCVNLDILRELQDVGPEILTEMITMYLANAKNYVAIIDGAAMDRDSTALNFHAHAFRSASAQLGAHLVENICLQLENIEDFGGIETAKEKAEQLKLAVLETEVKFRALNPSSGLYA